MIGSRNSLLLIVLLALPAAAKPRPVTSTLQGALRDSRAAYFQGDFQECIKRAMEVIVEDPENREARELMRRSAKELADAEIREIQEERHRLLMSAHQEEARRERLKREELALKLKEDRDFQAKLEAAEKARPAWSSWARAYVAHGEWLEAYRLVFLVKDQFPKDEWPALQLERLSRVVERERVELEMRPAWYREAVQGYQAYAAGNKEQAAALWRGALEKPGAEGYANRESIERRLAELGVSKPKAAGKAAAEKPAVARNVPAAAAKAPPPAPPAPPPPPKPGEIEALYVAGLVQYGMGHVGEALRTWEKVLALDPKHPAARRAAERAKKELAGGKP